MNPFRRAYHTTRDGSISGDQDGDDGGEHYSIGASAISVTKDSVNGNDIG
jgi:hypothetical protein